MNRRAVLVGASVAGLLAATGCGGAPAAPATEPVAQAEVVPGGPVSGGPVSGGPGGPVPASLAFTGRTLDGAPFDAAVLAGKPAVLWFWAPWCATCAMQADSITELKQTYGDRLGILGIAGLDDNKAMREFVTDFEVGSVPHLDDRSGELWRRFKVVEQSIFVFIDRQGAVVHTGWLDAVDLGTRVKTLVG